MGQEERERQCDAKMKKAAKKNTTSNFKRDKMQQQLHGQAHDKDRTQRTEDREDHTVSRCRYWALVSSFFFKAWVGVKSIRSKAETLAGKRSAAISDKKSGPVRRLEKSA